MSRMRAPKVFDDYNDDEPTHNVRALSCRICGAGPMTWHYTGVRNVLMNEAGRIHVCQPTADGFDDTTKD